MPKLSLYIHACGFVVVHVADAQEKMVMATTVTSAFTTFKTRLEIMDLQTQTVSTRQNNDPDAVSAIAWWLMPG